MSFIYGFLRVRYPYGTTLLTSEFDVALDTLGPYEMIVYDIMPAFHLIQMLLLFIQASYFLQLIDWLNKYVQLIGKGMRDASGFIMILIAS